MGDHWSLLLGVKTPRWRNMPCPMLLVRSLDQPRLPYRRVCRTACRMSNATVWTGISRLLLLLLCDAGTIPATAMTPSSLMNQQTTTRRAATDDASSKDASMAKAKELLAINKVLQNEK